MSRDMDMRVLRSCFTAPTYIWLNCSDIKAVCFTCEHNIRAFWPNMDLKCFCKISIQLKVRSVTNFMKQSPWETGSRSNSRKIPRFLWIPKIHYRVHKGPPLVRMLSQITPVHNLTPSFFKRSILTVGLLFRLRPDLPSRLLPSICPTKILYTFISNTHDKCPAQLTPLDLITLNNIWRIVHIGLLLWKTVMILQIWIEPGNILEKI
jgi:hypothetical protein